MFTAEKTAKAGRSFAAPSKTSGNPQRTTRRQNLRQATQRSFGNFALQEFETKSNPFVQAITNHELPILQRKCACGGTCPGCKGHSTAAALPISQPGDALEQQADQIADQLLTQWGSSVSTPNQ